MGIDDEWSGHDDVPKAMAFVDDPSLYIALAHDPRTADQLAEWSVPLVLSGHTHGGQVDIKSLTPKLFQSIGVPYISGWYEIGNTKLYVNTGVGSSVVRARIGTGALPEIGSIAGNTDIRAWTIQSSSTKEEGMESE